MQHPIACTRAQTLPRPCLLAPYIWLLLVAFCSNRCPRWSWPSEIVSNLDPSYCDAFCSGRDGLVSVDPTPAVHATGVFDKANSIQCDMQRITSHCSLSRKETRCRISWGGRDSHVGNTGLYRAVLHGLLTLDCIEQCCMDC